MLFSIKQKSDNQLRTNMNLNEGVQWRILKKTFEKIHHGKSCWEECSLKGSVTTWTVSIITYQCSALNIRRLETSYFYKFCDKTALAIPLRHL